MYYVGYMNAYLGRVEDLTQALQQG